MIRDRLRYHAPTDLDSACSLLEELPSPVVLAGGTTAIPRLGRGELRTDDVVHLSRTELDTISLEGDRVRIGSTVTYTQLLRSDLIRRRVPMLHTVASGITGGAQIRNQGTVGGSACYANPGSDIPGVLASLDAEFDVVSVRGRRAIPAADFFRGGFETALARGELLASILVPADDIASGVVKFKLSESSWPIVTAAARSWHDATGAARCQVGLGGVEPAPLVVDLTALLEDGTGVPTDLPPDAVAQRVSESLGAGWEDALAPREYRHAIAGTIATRAVQRLTGEAG